jgi:repressor LexA
MDISSRAVVRHYLSILDRKGSVTLQPGKSRGIILPEVQAIAALPMLSIPVFGTIPAGFPIEGQEEADSCITVDADTLHLPRNARTFALKVRGESMSGVNIVTGDTIILEFKEPCHGDIVAALIDGEVTLKRYLIRRGKPFLRAEHPDYPDLIPAQELVIQGVMVALLRIPRERKKLG